MTGTKRSVTMIRMMMTVLMAAVLGFTASGGEPVKERAPSPYLFSGGEKVKLIVPATVGETVDQIVSEDGFIALPLGGAINIKGKSILQAQDLVLKQIEKEAGARHVYVAIALLDVPAKKVYVGGEVKKPQIISITANNTLTLAGALAGAEGTTPEADLSRVNLIRLNADGTRSSFTFDASKLGRPGSTDVGAVLESGDIITVPRGDVFIVAGEVPKPGPYNRKELFLNAGEPARLSRVLYASGGLKPTANRKEIRLIRTGADGTKEVMPIDVDHAIASGSGKSKNEGQPGSRAQLTGTATAEDSGSDAEKPGSKAEENTRDPILQDGDMILAGMTGGVAILGRVKLPGIYPLGGEKLKLTRLIAMAGGFNEFAKTSSVLVIPAATPNKPVRVDVNAITKDGRIEQDMDLVDGDLVFVGERLL